MWIDFFRKINDKLTFNPPATIESINSVELELNLKFPQSLKNLLLESNGVEDEYSVVIWSIERILEENIDIRNDYSEELDNFNDFLLFSDAGNGDLFAFLLKDGNVNIEEIYVWNHEDESREILSSSLDKFIKGWIEGTIEI